MADTARRVEMLTHGLRATTNVRRVLGHQFVRATASVSRSSYVVVAYVERHQLHSALRFEEDFGSWIVQLAVLLSPSSVWHA